MNLGAIAVLMASVGLVAGCAGDEPAVTLPSVEASPTAFPSTPTGGSTDQQSLPETQSGAAAFVRYYFTAVNEAYSERSTTEIARLGSQDCRTCLNVTADVERLRAAGNQVDGQRFKVELAEASPAGQDGRFLVDVRFSSDAYREEGADGMLVREQPPQQSVDLLVTVAKDVNDWRILEIVPVGGAGS